MQLRSLLPLAAAFALGGTSTARALEDVVVVSPQDGAVVPQAFEVDVTYTKIQYCDTDGCNDYDPNQITLFADTAELMLLGSCYPSGVGDLVPCPGGAANFAVELTPGEYTLTAEASVSLEQQKSLPVKVTVQADATSGATGGASSGAESGSSTGEADSSTGPDAAMTDSGCGCRSSSSAGLAWLLAPWLVLRRPR